MVTGSYSPIIILKVNGYIYLKKDPYICYLQKTHLKRRDTYRQKVRGWKKIFYANRNQKNAGKAIFISDQVNFKIKTVRRNKEAHYIMMNPKRKHSNYIYLSICTRHRSTSIHKAKSNIKGETSSNTIIVGT